MEEVINGILIREVETKNIMTKSSLPVGGYSVNPYVGCTHACKYCYASFMKRFTGHKEEWGTFLDVKHWPEIKNPKKYAGQRVVIGSVTDGYNPQEEQFGNIPVFPRTAKSCLPRRRKWSVPAPAAVSRSMRARKTSPVRIGPAALSSGKMTASGRAAGRS